MNHRNLVCGLGLAALLGVAAGPGQAGEYQLFARSNLMAWCIVPFDARERGPEERAAMMERLGIRNYAYDYRAKHIPTFDQEVLACQKHGVRIVAWLCPPTLNDEAKLILDLLQRHKVKAQLWIVGSGKPTTTDAEQQAQVEALAGQIRPLAEAAGKIGCSVALYNHGGWFGQPENQVAIIQRIGLPNVGIVYNQHHGHEHLDRFAGLMALMKPHLLALNLNGMVKDGDQKGMKIMPLGQGDLDLDLLKIIRDSGWEGPVGILNHTSLDAEVRLKENLEGFDWLVKQLEGKPAGPRPKPETWKKPAN